MQLCEIWSSPSGNSWNRRQPNVADSDSLEIGENRTAEGRLKRDGEGRASAKTKALENDPNLQSESLASSLNSQ
jgi:hypothetical protein